MATPSYSFREAELKSPWLHALNWLGARVESIGIDAPKLTSDTVVRAAQTLAGSKNLGGDSFREPLDRYLQAVRDEADLNLFGRLAVKSMLVQSLRNRIELATWVSERPEVREQEIKAPWVIVGLPRTGTSLLSILLGLDPNARS